MPGAITSIRTSLNSMLHFRLKSKIEKSTFDSKFNQIATNYNNRIWRQDKWYKNYKNAGRSAIAVVASIIDPMDGIIAIPTLLTLHLMAQGFRKGGLYTLFAHGDTEKVAEVKWAIGNINQIDEGNVTPIQSIILKLSERATDKISNIFDKLPEDRIDEIEEATQKIELQNIIMTSQETPEVIAKKIHKAISSYEVSAEVVEKLLSDLEQKNPDKAKLIRATLKTLEENTDFFNTPDKKTPPTIKEDLLNIMKTEQNIDAIVNEISEAISSGKISAEVVEKLLSTFEDADKADSIRRSWKLIEDVDEELKESKGEEKPVSTEGLMKTAGELETKEEESKVEITDEELDILFDKEDKGGEN